MRRRASSPGVAARRIGAVALALVGAVALVGTATPAGAQTNPQVTTAALPATEVSAAYRERLSASGGAGGDHWSAVGALPAGLTLSSAGVLSGRATLAGSFELTVAVTDDDGDTGQATLSLEIAPGPTITTASLPSGEVGSDYSVTLGESGGTAPFTWSIPSGGIPGGLLLQSSGVLEGRPGTAGATELTVEVADALGATATATYAVRIAPAPLAPETLSLVTSSGELLTLSSPATASTPALVVTRLAGGLPAALVPVPGAIGAWEVTASGRVRGIGTASLGEVVRAHVRIAGAGAAIEGYWLASATGRVFPIGGAPHVAVRRVDRLRVAALVPSGGGKGFWIVSTTGAVYAFGTARRARGAPRGVHIVAAAAAPDGEGIWALSASGKVYGLAGAKSLGSLPRAHRGTAVAIAATTHGTGYWVVTRIGGVYGFGSARALAPVPPGYRIVAAAN